MTDQKPCNWGSCYEQCGCECMDEDEEYFLEECVCGHRAHQTKENGITPYDNPDEHWGAWCPDTWCGEESCKLVPCMLCGSGAPLMMSDCHGGFCSAMCAMTGCAAGPVSRSGVGECPICYETVPLVKLAKCTHEVCVECRSRQVFANERNMPDDAVDLSILSACPICRANNSEATDRSRPFEHLREMGRAQAELRTSRNGNNAAA